MYFSRDKRDVSIKRDLFPPPLKYIFYIYIYVHTNVYITHETKIRVKILTKFPLTKMKYDLEQRNFVAR